MIIKVKFTGGIPICPNCQIPTERLCKGSSTTLLGWSTTYDEAGELMNSDPNIKTQYWQCCNCNDDYIIKGNEKEGYKYI